MKKTYSFADEIFQIDTVYEYFHKFAKEYLSKETPTYFIKVTEEEIDSWKASHDDTDGFSKEYLETLVIHAKIAEILVFNNKLIFHGSSIYVNNKENAYIFTAPSGTGKSTHVSILRKVYKDEINYVNDDKPFLSYDNESFFVYGSPWNGKEGLSNVVKATLKGIFLLTRGKTNKVSKVSPKEAIGKLITQIHIPKGIKETTLASSMLVKLTELVPCYLLEVNMDDDAAKTSYEIMKGSK